MAHPSTSTEDPEDSLITELLPQQVQLCIRENTYERNLKIYLHLHALRSSSRHGFGNLFGNAFGFRCISTEDRLSVLLVQSEI
jgi:hypothetical protein